MSFHFETTFTTQIEILPRLCIVYSADWVVGFEFLWFSFYIDK